MDSTAPLPLPAAKRPRFDTSLDAGLLSAPTLFTTVLPRARSERPSMNWRPKKAMGGGKLIILEPSAPAASVQAAGEAAAPAADASQPAQLPLVRRA
jgi:hypothetical protein